MSMVIARILLRYIAAAIVTAGYLSPELADQIGTDPDLIMALGTVIGLLTEAAYGIAKAKGGKT
jgi:hypothetical protein